MELPPEEGKVRDEEKISDPVTAAGDVNVKKESCDACVQDACTQHHHERRRDGVVVEVGVGGCLPSS